MSKANPEIKDIPLGKLKSGANWHEDAGDLESVIDARLQSLQSLLITEDKIRRAKTENELQHLITNETRKFSGARQVFLLRRKNKGNHIVTCVSSMAITERDTPLIRWVEQLVGNLPTDGTKDTKDTDNNQKPAVNFELPGFADASAEETKSYPFRYLCWQPLKLADRTEFAGLLLAKNSPWNKTTTDTLAREAEFYAHAWSALQNPEKLRPNVTRSSTAKLAASLVAILALFAPIPLTTLAPVEIIAENPFIVAASINGVVDRILINPNQHVTTGQPIVKFIDTKFRNRLEIAKRDMRVAEAVYRRVSQAAFFSVEARHQLAISKAEFELKRSEFEYATEEYQQTIVKAPRPGLAIFASKDEWKGKPVVTGEQIMRIANPRNTIVSINLPVADAIVIKQGASVRLFLDADPLSAIAATISETSYHAVPSEGNNLVYKLRAKLSKNGKKPPRIGARGTAQIYGADVPLAFLLFRRPLSWLRQNLGI